MNLLSKLNSSAKTKTIEPREIFMTLPSKAPGYGYPRDVQSEVWKKWFDIRNEKNVILKMNTGSGKTVVGLIMLQSCLNEEKGPAIYVVPDNYLVKQVIDEAKRLGISATVDKDDYNYSNSKAILVTSIQTIVNGHSYFGMREAGNYPIGSIIIDDVHACMDKIIDQFMIKIDAETDAYKELIALFNSSLKDYNPKNYIDVVEMKDCRNNILVPYWEWQRQQDNIYRILTKYNNSDNTSIYFGLPLIERCLETCDCIITASAIEISPKGIDLDKISSLEEASRRIYMSATLADDSVFVSALGLDTEDMKNIITPENANDMGDRLIIFPKYVNSDISEIEIKEKVEESEYEKFEEALNQIGVVLGFVCSRPDKETGGYGPDNLWAIDSNKYLVIECKTEATTQTIKKDYCNQLSGSVNWFKENYVYPNECTPIIVHPSKFVDVVASPDENMRVMTEEELTCFRKNIRDFYSALCHNGSISDISKINELLSIYKLRKDDIVNRYTVKFERQK